MTLQIDDVNKKSWEKINALWAVKKLLYFLCTKGHYDLCEFNLIVILIHSRYIIFMFKKKYNFEFHRFRYVENPFNFILTKMWCFQEKYIWMFKLIVRAIGWKQRQQQWNKCKAVIYLKVV